MARTPQPAGLVGVLLDRSAPLGDRDDAAMDLSGFDERAALDALAAVGSDPAEDEDLLDRCGESIAHIWQRLGEVDAATAARLTSTARSVLVATLEALAPELVPALRRPPG